MPKAGAEKATPGETKGSSSSPMTEILDERIAELEGQGAHRYDPVRFRYIQSLAARSCGKPKEVAALIQKKALAAIDAYRKEFDNARSEAKMGGGPCGRIVSRRRRQSMYAL